MGLFLLALGLIALVRAMLFWAFILQTKEYRADRLRDFTRSGEGRRALRSSGLFWQIPLAAISLVALEMPGLDQLGEVFLSALFLISGLLAIRSAARRGWRMPRLTARMAMILAAADVLVLAVWIAVVRETGTTPVFGALMTGLVLLPLAGFVVFVAHLAVLPIALFLRHRALTLGRAARDAMPELRAAVVVGSFGKSSTKEMLANLLEHAGVPGVIRSEKNENTEMALAASARKLAAAARQRASGPVNQERSADSPAHRLTGSPAVWIAEAGAYGPDEIRESCRIVQPSVAILTGLDDAHLALFGSREIQTAAKFEAADALPAGGFLLANAESPRVAAEVRRRIGAGELKKLVVPSEVEGPFGGTRLFDSSKTSTHDPHKDLSTALRSGRDDGVFVVLYGTSAGSDVRASDLRLTEAGWTFCLHVGASELPVRTRLFSRALAQNLVGAMGAAIVLGADPERVARAAAEIPNPPHTFTPVWINPATRRGPPGGSGTLEGGGSEAKPSVGRGEHREAGSPLRAKLFAIDDGYNANPTGAREAVQVLAALPSPSAKVLVLDDVLELGDESAAWHRELGREIARIPGLRAALLLGQLFPSEVEAGLRTADFSGEIVRGADAAETFLRDFEGTALFEGRRAGDLLAVLQAGTSKEPLG